MARSGSTGKKRGRPSGRRLIDDQGFGPQAQLDFFTELDELHRRVAAATDAVKEWKNEAQRRGADKFVLGLTQRVRKMVEKGTISPGEVPPMIDRLREYCFSTIPGIQDVGDETDAIVAGARSGHGAGAFPLQ